MRVKFNTPDVAMLTKDYMVIDMHFHSRFSPDSSTKVKTIVNRAEKMGVYVALTDHNSINGVLRAEEIAPGRIKPGVEITTKEGKDILIYFYEVDDLIRFFRTNIQQYVKNKSSLRQGKTGISTKKLFKLLENEKCLIAIAHPFAVGPRHSYKFFRNGHAEVIPQVHAVEVVNQALPHKRNLAAVGWAEQLDKSIIGGSDGHIADMLGSAFTCCAAESWGEFLDEIKKKHCLVVGEERKLRSHVTNMARILKEKAKVMENKRIREGGD